MVRNVLKETSIYTKCIIMHTLLTLAVSDAFTESLHWFKFLTSSLWSCSGNVWATHAMCVNMWTTNGNAVMKVWTNLYKGSRTPLSGIIISFLSCTSYLLNNHDCEVFLMECQGRIKWAATGFSALLVLMSELWPWRWMHKVFLVLPTYCLLYLLD